ncbi:MAG: peptidoglycan bridge formation glycyltransferase FemA/FemB family protein [Spirochaetales bacterium]|nr:peptidoglycan bridge formation glycyltransferase FemA/FemB family protein [Spirochaetales bacterium]
MPLSLTSSEPGKLEDHDNLLQTGFWGRMKSSFGWKSHEFQTGEGNPLLVLTRSLGGIYYLAYIPNGPDLHTVASGDWAGLKALALLLKQKLPKGAVFIRFDLPWEIKIDDIDRKTAPGFRRASMDIQPPSTVILDITPSEDEILASMKKKNRYNIRLSEKKGVVIREAGIEALPLWYHIYEETAKRDKIALHEYDYYEKLFKLALERQSKYPDIRLFLAEIEGEVEAGIIISIQGNRATYLYGASSSRKRNFMPSYGLQWAAIRCVKAAGCTEYDLYGIPPTEDPEHPMAGLYRFKTGFGGHILHRPGSWDFPAAPMMYGAYRLAERLRGWYYRKVRKRGR